LDLVGHGTPPSGHPSPLPNFKIETDLLVVASQFDMSEQVPAGNGDVFFLGRRAYLQGFYTVSLSIVWSPLGNVDCYYLY
jgi:hypothetical protein